MFKKFSMDAFGSCGMLRREEPSEEERKANEESLTELLNSLYNENIELGADEILKNNATFETNFAIYLKQGQEKYKDLPCGELHFDSSGLTKVQIGYRYSGVEFI